MSAAAKKPLPDKVRRGIEARTGTPLGARGATVALCRHCNAPTFRGLDHDITALPATTDVTPLNAAGEATALIAGRRTYRLDWTVRGGRGRYELTRRDQFQIAGTPAGTPGVDVLAEHHCHHQLGQGRLHTGPPPAPPTDPTDQPPF